MEERIGGDGEWRGAVRGGWREQGASRGCAQQGKEGSRDPTAGRTGLQQTVAVFFGVAVFRGPRSLI